MSQSSRLRIAIQKSGRLHQDSIDLLSRCGMKIRIKNDSLYCRADNMPVDILFVRDDDIPTLVNTNVCDLGIVGENVLSEKTLTCLSMKKSSSFELVIKLGFSHCRLVLAVPMEMPFESIHTLEHCKIATSYPAVLKEYLAQNKVDAKIIVISGSVEITPRINVADAICDLVATGRTLEENNLREVLTILQSEAVLIRTRIPLEPQKLEIYEQLLRRIMGVIKADESKYIMFHAPKNSVQVIKALLSGSESPTILPIDGIEDKVAVHLVAREKDFWSTLEKLKVAGASSILVLPIEKMML